MKRLKILSLLGAFSIKLTWAAAYIAIPDLAYSPGTTDYKISNIDIKGAIIKSGKFKVIHTPSNFNVEATIDEITAKQQEQDAATNANKVDSFQLGKPVAKKNNKDPKYILVGKVVNSEIRDNYYPVQGTDKSTASRNLDVSVEYYVLNLEDKSVIASFNVNAVGSQTSILQGNQKYQTAQGRLIKETSLDLAKQVMDELSLIDTKSDENYSALVKNFSGND